MSNLSHMSMPTNLSNSNTPSLLVKRPPSDPKRPGKHPIWCKRPSEGRGAAPAPVAGQADQIPKNSETDSVEDPESEDESEDEDEEEKTFFAVRGVRTVYFQYVVKARNKEEALELAEDGEGEYEHNKEWERFTGEIDRV